MLAALVPFAPMNRFLAKVLQWGNSVLAILIVLAGFLLGQQEGNAALGAIAGFITAVAFCGTLAVFLDTRQLLEEIRDLLADPERNPE
ncbi:MAG: hypothetical protein F4228_04720 [Acidobacteria bacterium]|nr:hypothetical protein [Acidobacteriota bacterium]MYB31934.1 hypothetical protein [Acidobacteriota bacterium]MYF13985.1 hypothetical protein [Acidobacteriota bacterium]MYH22584.1 hypothetical protein [Acidobacteriota bacterium]MYI95769.1 hypothetical protein [Acidobacteriota bacterium]